MGDIEKLWVTHKDGVSRKVERCYLRSADGSLREISFDELAAIAKEREAVLRKGVLTELAIVAVVLLIIWLVRS